MIPQFNNDDVKWVRSPKGGKTGVLNVECRSISVATAVKSTFAGLVKSDRPPSYLKNVSDLLFVVMSFLWSLRARVISDLMLCLSYCGSQLLKL